MALMWLLRRLNIDVNSRAFLPGLLKGDHPQSDFFVIYNLMTEISKHDRSTVDKINNFTGLGSIIYFTSFFMNSYKFLHY